MEAQHVANLRALRVAAFAAGKALEFDRSLRVRVGQLARRDLRPKAIEKVDQDFEIRIHSIR